MRILTLEDSANDAELNKATINARWPECEVVRAVNREEFVAALDQGGFDIILSDFTLPGFNGQKALELARDAVKSATGIIPARAFSMRAVGAAVRSTHAGISVPVSLWGSAELRLLVHS